MTQPAGLFGARGVRQLSARLLSSTASARNQPASTGMFARAQQYARSQDPAERNRIAIVDGAGTHTYKQLLRDAHRVRAALLAPTKAQAVSKGKGLDGARVAMLMPNTYEYAAVQWGIWAAGGAAVPLSPMHPARELEYFISDSGARTVVCHPTLLGNIEPAARQLGDSVQVVPSDTCLHSKDDADAGGSPIDVDETQGALFIYTSGTTGRPKGVVHTHASLGAQIAALHAAWQWSADDRLLHVLPLHHVHGIVVGLCAALGAGATTEMMPGGFDARHVWGRITDGPRDITLLMGVPTMYTRLLAAFDAMPGGRQLDARRAIGALRLTISGSAALPASVFARWREATGHAMLERYGMSEIGMALSNDATDPDARRPGSVGTPLPGVSVRLVDSAGVDVTAANPSVPGMLQIKGPSVFREYHGLPDKTASEFTADGWFVTGDIATRSPSDQGGLFYIMGRESVDIIKSGGFKLSALEIERDLLEHPSIADVAVVGVPSEEWGETAAAAVVLKPGAPELPIETLKPWCYSRMARYKAPKMVRAVDALPRNLMGKLDKKAVRALFSS
ncbi:hypothetical protein IWW48_001720 [Coemansia sp. RSA 1200]|nr:hypothetical protein IWW48_001720 [Coemansia sp. RSA 1200]